MKISDPFDCEALFGSSSPTSPISLPPPDSRGRRARGTQSARERGRELMASLEVFREVPERS